MPDYLGSLTSDIRARISTIDRELSGVQALIDEKQELERVLAVLEDERGEAKRSAPRRRSASRPRRKPAARGERRSQLVAAVRAEPTISPAALADQLGTSRNNIYALIRKL